MASKKNEKSVRTRNFCAVVYDEDIKYCRVKLAELETRGLLRAFYLIMHNPESDDKSSHFHILFEYYDARTLSAVQKHFSELRDSKIEVCTDLRSYACYMIHKYEIDKKRYDTSLVFTNDMERYRLLVTSDNGNQVSSDKVFMERFYDLLYSGDEFHNILLNLCRDKNFTIKQVRSNVYLMKNFYCSLNKHLNGLA